MLQIFFGDAVVMDFDRNFYHTDNIFITPKLMINFSIEISAGQNQKLVAKYDKRSFITRKQVSVG